MHDAFQIPQPAPDRFDVVAPGRVNLIGEHTDYNDGFVLPMAIDRGIRLTVRRRDDRRAVLVSHGEPGSAFVDLDTPLVRGRDGWTAYPLGVLAGFQARGWTIPGFEAVVAGDLPAGGGLSSSAALEVATATAVEALCGRSLAPEEKALLCQQAEHDFAGVPCGIMDQFAVVFGRAGHALLLDCRSRSRRHVPLAAAIRILVVNSGVRHALASGKYAARRAECRAAAERLGCPTLRDVTPEVWQARAAALPGVERRRAAHVLAENARTLAFVAALERSDWPAAGRLMRESHVSLAADYEVSCPELDALVSVAGDVPGVYGCRMTGGGFGGCAVALVDAAAAEAALEAIGRGYREATGIEAEMFDTTAAAGPRVDPS